MTTEQFSIQALQLGDQGVQRFDIADLEHKLHNGDLIWLHFAGDAEKTQAWLREHPVIPDMAIDALCTEFTRPRFHTDADKQLLLTLRTTRHTPQLPLDYTSLRLFAKQNLIISVSLRSNNVVDAFVESLDQAEIQSRNRLFVALFFYVAEEFTDYINELDEEVIALEDSWEDKRRVDLDQLIFVRQKVTRLSRYMLPQLEAAQKLSQFIDGHEFDQAEKVYHQENWTLMHNSIRRDIEAIVEMRERLSILQETMQQHSSNKINRTMYVLSLVATFFLPLTFVTGLLGMNVGGIPASDNSTGFWIVCALMLIIGVLQWVLFKRWQWLR